MRPRCCATLFLLTLALPAGAAAATGGAALYRSQCAQCHGVDGRGDGADAPLLAKKPPSLRGGAAGRATVAELVAKIHDGRELPLALDQQALRARAREVESLVAFLRRLPALDWEAIEAGEPVYFTRCADCHGETGKPPASTPAGVAAPRDLSEPAFQASTSDAQLLEAVRHGRAGMPALVPRLAPDAGPPLAAYVRLFSPGFTSYQTYCVGCHGRDGRGVGTLGEEMRLPTVVFDRAYFERTDPEDLRRRVWHMAAEQEATMPHYQRVLDEAQTRAVAEYLRQAFH